MKCPSYAANAVQPTTKTSSAFAHAVRYKRSYAGNTPKSYWQGMTAAKQSLIEELVADGWEPIIKDNGEIDALKRLRS